MCMHTCMFDHELILWTKVVSLCGCRSSVGGAHPGEQDVIEPVQSWRTLPINLVTPLLQFLWQHSKFPSGRLDLQCHIAHSHKPRHKSLWRFPMRWHSRVSLVLLLRRRMWPWVGLGEAVAQGMPAGLALAAPCLQVSSISQGTEMVWNCYWVEPKRAKFSERGRLP